jgi:hypothetical protein
MQEPAMKIVVFAAMAAVLSMGAAAAGSNTPAEDEDGWVTMFDGKSLDGWKINEQPKSWSVADGAIVANGERSHLFYVGNDKPYVNFHFKAEVKTKPRSNSGIYFHAGFVKEGWPTQQGYECQVNNSGGDPQKTGGLYNTVKVLKAPAKDNEWYTQEIIVKGKRVIVKINDKTVVDYSEPEGKEGPVRLGKGTFALQAHDPGSTVYYKNIRVKRLP